MNELITSAAKKRRQVGQMGPIQAPADIIKSNAVNKNRSSIRKDDCSRGRAKRYLTSECALLALTSTAMGYA